MTEERDPEIRWLLDRAAIIDCLHRYARGMDRLDRELARSAYHDGAVDDHVGFAGDVEDFLDWAFDYHGTQVRHQHYVSNHFVEIDGDEAHAESYFTFVGTERADGAPLTVFGGRYVDRFERREKRWGIVARACVVEWATTPDSLLPPESTGAEGVGTVARSREDISYDRPLVVRDDLPSV